MDKKTKFLILDIIGALFVFWSILAISLSMYNQNPTQVLFMCYLGMLIIGIGILTKRSFLILSQVYILAIPLILWDIDFIFWLIAGRPFLGITDYFFSEGVSLIGNIVSLQHLFTVPLAIYSAGLIGIKRLDAWKWSFIQLILVYVFVSIFSDPVSNINCVFNPCINFYTGLPYRLTWFIVLFSMTFITSVILARLKIIKTKK